MDYFLFFFTLEYFFFLLFHFDDNQFKNSTYFFFVCVCLFHVDEFDLNKKLIFCFKNSFIFTKPRKTKQLSIMHYF